MEANYKIINFIELDKDMLLEILKWRNDESVRKNMRNSNIISENEHFEFLKSLLDNATKKYFLVKKNDTPIGVISITDITELSVAEGGLYANPTFIGQKVGNILMEILLEVSKDIFGLKKLTLVVKKDNPRALKLYENFGFSTEAEQDEYYITGKVLK